MSRISVPEKPTTNVPVVAERKNMTERQMRLLELINRLGNENREPTPEELATLQDLLPEFEELENAIHSHEQGLENE